MCCVAHGASKADWASMYLAAWVGSVIALGSATGAFPTLLALSNLRYPWESWTYYAKKRRHMGNKHNKLKSEETKQPMPGRDTRLATYIEGGAGFGGLPLFPGTTVDASETVELILEVLERPVVGLVGDGGSGSMIDEAELVVELS